MEPEDKKEEALDNETEKQQYGAQNTRKENRNQAATNEMQGETNEIIQLDAINEDANESSFPDSDDIKQETLSSDQKQMENTGVKNKKAHSGKGSQKCEKESKISEMKKPKLQLSARLEHIARPKKDFLETQIKKRLDGSVPEGAPPMWNILPLQTKIPLNECPLPVTTKRIGSKLFLPTPGKDFDLWDENNHFLPSEMYDSHHDPHLKGYYKMMPDHLLKDGYATESGRATCTLNDINVYRRYQRRILAADVLQKLRDEDEEFRIKRTSGAKERVKRDMEKYHERRTQGKLRRWIKNTVASIEETSMKKQMIRDMKVLNSQIKRQRTQTERVKAKEEWYQQLFAQHAKRKYDICENRSKAHLAFAKKDMEVLIKLHQREEKKKEQKKEKVKEFWKRKYEWQKEWIDLGVELEQIREQEKQNNLKILKETGRLPLAKNTRKGSNQHSRNMKNEGNVEVEDKNLNEGKRFDQSDAVTPEESVQNTKAEDRETLSNDNRPHDQQVANAYEKQVLVKPEDPEVMIEKEDLTTPSADQDEKISLETNKALKKE